MQNIKNEYVSALVDAEYKRRICKYIVNTEYAITLVDAEYKKTNTQVYWSKETNVQVHWSTEYIIIGETSIGLLTIAK